MDPNMTWVEQQLSILERNIVLGKESSEIKLAEALAGIRALSDALCLQRRREEEKQMISETVEHFNGIAWTIVTGYEDVSIKNYEEYGCPLGESATCDRCDYCKLDKCTHPVAARVENNK